MALNITSLLLIILITSFLSTQGLVTSMLALATALFSSILAMGLLEMSQGAMFWRIDHARGITFLGLFLVIFAVTRFAADFAVPKNIKFPRLVNRLGGGLVGFFAALTVVGTIIIGVEMLPLGSSILGFERFPPESAMRSEEPGKPGKMNKLWFSPDGFVQSVWNGASGRALGGRKAWATVHPDLTAESYGYRYVVAKASQRSVHPELFSSTEAWTSTDPKELQPLGIPLEPGQRIVMVRTKIEKGLEPPKVSADQGGGDHYFRASAAQVRLVAQNKATRRAHQYFPIGYLEFGRKFIPLSLDSGHVVDDYSNNAVIHDWVFAIPEEEKPDLIEVKQFARAEITNLRDKVTSGLASNMYPQRAYLKDLGTVTVNVTLKDRKFVDGTVYILKSGVKNDEVKSDLFSASERVMSIRSSINANAGGWQLPIRGVPSRNDFINAANEGPQLTNAQPDQVFPWNTVIRMMLLAQAVPDGERNYASLPKYFDDKIVPLMRSGKEGSAILDSAPIPESGSVEIGRIMPGSKSILVVLRTRTSYALWLKTEEFAAKENVTLNLNGDTLSGDTAPFLKIDLEEKIDAPPAN